jgi:hypothetical protein
VEAEYIATAEAAREAIWLRNLLRELGFKSLTTTTLHVDNQGALRLAMNPSTHQRTKHIDIKHHLIRDCDVGSESAEATTCGGYVERLCLAK